MKGDRITGDVTAGIDFGLVSCRAYKLPHNLLGKTCKPSPLLLCRLNVQIKNTTA